MFINYKFAIMKKLSLLFVFLCLGIVGVNAQLPMSGSERYGGYVMGYNNETGTYDVPISGAKITVRTYTEIEPLYEDEVGGYTLSGMEEIFTNDDGYYSIDLIAAIPMDYYFIFECEAKGYIPQSRTVYHTESLYDYYDEELFLIREDFNLQKKCETPTITLIGNGKIKVESATEGATCVTSINASNADALTSGEISLTPLTVYTVTAYATADGYADSDVATATFRWEKKEGDMNGDGQVNIADVIQLVNIILQQ